MISLGVVGSRTFNDYSKMCSVLDHYKEEGVGIGRIVSGGAQGADKLAQRYADEHGILFLLLEAQWNKNGREAGFIRNRSIVANSDRVVAFWDGKSPGTRDTIQKCRAANVPISIVNSF